MMLLFTLLEHTTANFLLELPVSPSSVAAAAVFPCSRIAFAAILQPATSTCSALFALFVSPPPPPPPRPPSVKPPAEEVEEEEDEEEEEEEPSCGAASALSSESSEKGRIAGGGAGDEEAGGIDEVDFVTDFGNEVSSASVRLFLLLLPSSLLSLPNILGEPAVVIEGRAAGAPPAVTAGATATAGVGAGEGAGAEPAGRLFSVMALLLSSRALFMLGSFGC